MQRRPVFLQVTITGFLAAALLAASLLALPAEAATSEAEDVVEDRPGRPATPEVPVYADWVEDSGLPAEFGRRVAWMEDGRVLFPMQRLRNPSAPPSRDNLVADLAIWTPGTPVETVENHSGDYVTGICYANGYLRYVTSERQDGQYVSMMGRLGQEQRIAYSDRPSGARYSGFSCRYEMVPERWAGQHLIYPLMPSHGWIRIRIQPAREPGATILYPTHDHPGIELELNDQDVRIDCFRWIPWRQAYFTDTCGHHPTRGETGFSASGCGRTAGSRFPTCRIPKA